MDGFEYGNARLRAMRSSLLTQEEILQMAGASSLTEFIGMLAKTPYRKTLEIALVQTGDLDSIYDAVRRNFSETAIKLRTFYTGKVGSLVQQVLLKYSLHNLKAILHGLSHHAEGAEIENALLPVGSTPESVLSQLLHAANPREAVDILATIGHPLAQPLLILRAEKPGADLADMEQALDSWYVLEVSRAAKQDPDGYNLILSALRQEMDIRNIMTVLRFVHSPSEQQMNKARVERNGFAGLFSAFGTISNDTLYQLYATKNMKQALALLMHTVYAQPLNEGLSRYEHAGRLSEIERSLRRYQLHWYTAQIARDPLGIGVVMGFLALKAAEVNNLRRIARGIQLKLDPDASRAELEFAR